MRTLHARLAKLEERIRDESVSLVMPDGSVRRLRFRSLRGDEGLDLVARAQQQAYAGGAFDSDVALVARSVAGDIEGCYLLELARVVLHGPAESSDSNSKGDDHANTD